MKNKTLVCVTLAILLMTGSFHAFAAYPVKHNAAANENTAINTTVSDHLPTSDRAADKIYSAAERVRNVLHKEKSILPERRKTDTIGLLSLIFGIAGLVFFGYGFPFSIAAIVLGAIGMKKKERFSVAGLVLGIVGLLVEIIVIVAVVLLLSAFSL